MLARDLEARTDAPLDPRWPLARLAEAYPGCRDLQRRRPDRGDAGGAGPARAGRRDLPGAGRHGAARGGRRADVARAAELARSGKDLDEHEFAVALGGGGAGPALQRRRRARLPVRAARWRTSCTSRPTSSGWSATAPPRCSWSPRCTPRPPSAAPPAPSRWTSSARSRAWTAGATPARSGWTDASGDGEWGIALRCAELDPADPHRLRLFAGCGIVSGSVPDDELAETVAKLVPMRDALQD